MRIGSPTEVKNREARVGLTPMGAAELIRNGHEVFIQSNAGVAVGFSDEDYQASGCEITPDADSLFDAVEMIIKVKEPQPEEIVRLKPEHLLFTYLHLAPDEAQASGLARSGATCIAYETVTSDDGRLPLLTPMSEVAGRLSIQAGAKYLEIANGGSGVLLGGVTGVACGKVLIIGGGVAGLNAAQMAIGLGAEVTIMDRSIDRLAELNLLLDNRAKVIFSTEAAISEAVKDADLVVGSVLIPGASAPKIITREHVSSMKRGSVMVDIAIDQGGCFETSRPTSHDDPVYKVSGVVHYCVTNMPACVARTATIALSNATLPYAIQLANKGVDRALNDNRHLAAGLNVRGGEIVHPDVISSLRLAS